MWYDFISYKLVIPHHFRFLKLTWVLLSGLAHHRVPSRLSSAIFLFIW